MSKIFFMGLSLLVVVAIIFLIYPNFKPKIYLEKTTDVEKIISNPEKFKGKIGVSGKVLEIDKSKNIFLLGCEDACIRMPVKYEKELPDMGKEIIAYGEVKKDSDGKFFFKAEFVKIK